MSAYREPPAERPKRKTCGTVISVALDDMEFLARKYGERKFKILAELIEKFVADERVETPPA